MFFHQGTIVPLAKIEFFANPQVTSMISKRPATEADKPFLVWLEEACMREYAVALWGSWPSGLSVRDSIDCCQIIIDGGHDVGCVTVEKHSDHLWLDELFIEPKSQRRGIGSSPVGCHSGCCDSCSSASLERPDH
ncbi:GNAT family N-acetyltransferase (plasmid) [Rhizobium sp. T1470]|uniref:GNAT family N-acetyltransferase n=1 Tax=unclassified Rhizobium TaxID=2613769 RepID=UPI001AAE7BA4|nr:GNAT family N-acetyltransferase [Rhizobium sp. T1473]MCA0805230.1 GNAT family N-acetyltransferase [Rhizobium sp. T1473]